MRSSIHPVIQLRPVPLQAIEADREVWLEYQAESFLSNTEHRWIHCLWKPLGGSEVRLPASTSEAPRDAASDHSLRQPDVASQQLLR